MMNKLSLESLDKKMQRLPSLPVVVTDILAMIQRGDVNLHSLDEKLSKDQALSAQTLRIANSAFYGFSRNIGSIKEAVVILGIHAIRNLVTAAGIINQFSPDSSARLNRAMFWQHSIGTSIAARVMAKRTGLDQEIAFTAGLLHDVGKLILDTYFPEHYEKVQRYQKEHDCLLRDAEEAVLGFDHTVVGGRVAKLWKLPSLIVDVIESHHQSEKNATHPLVALVHCADIICRGLNIGNGGDDLIPQLNPDALQCIGHDWNTLKGCLQEIEEHSAAASSIFITESSY